MRKLAALPGLAALLTAAATAQQPAIATGGILNAASFAFQGLPNSSIARGSIFYIYGTNLFSTAQQASGPLQTTLGDTSVTVTVGATNVNALIMWFIADGRIVALLPSNTPEGDGSVTVTYKGQTSAPAPITVVRSGFGIFTVNSAGSGPGVFTGANYKLNALTAPARPGDVLTVWGTGLGPVAFDETTGAPFQDLTNLDVQVLVGGRLAQIQFRGRSPGSMGLDQINFVVPAGMEGCYVPVVVKVGGVVSNFATLSISSNAVCADAAGLSAAQIQQAQTGLRLGSISLTSMRLRASAPGGTLDLTSDLGTANFQRYDLRRLQTSWGLTGAPSAGTCTVYQFRGDFKLEDPVRGDGLDAGTLTVTGPNGALQFVSLAKGIYNVAVTRDTDPALPSAGFLVPGPYTLAGSGGADIKPLTVTFRMPEALSWTNQDAISAVSRAQNLTVTWSGGDPNGFVQILGASSLPDLKVGAAFLCTERNSAASFTVPAEVLSALPKTEAAAGTVATLPSGLLLVGGTPPPQAFTATGLDAGYLIYTILTGKPVSFE